MVRVVAALDVAPALWGGPWIPAIPVGADEYEEEAVGELTSVLEVAGPLDAAGLDVEAELLRGRPSLAIPDDARLWKPDLTVVGSRGHGPVESALLGSVSSAVVDHAESPVLVARGDHASGDRWPRTARRPASPLATWSSWSAFAGIPVRVVGVVDVAAPWRSGIAPTMFSASMDIYAEMITRLGRDVRPRRRSDGGHLQAAGRTADGELREGDPADQLGRAVHDAAGDLIVIGSRGHTRRQPDRDGQRGPQRPAPRAVLRAGGEAAAPSRSGGTGRARR